MSIPCLTSYVYQRSHTNFKEFELHDTQLIIDGNCIVFHLYDTSKCSYCFGGDYGKYADYVSQFLDELLKCNITPLIIFDGGLEDKTLHNKLFELKESLKLASNSTPSKENPVLPILAKDVFKSVAKQRKIKMVQSSFKATHHIASVARLLKCPVLSDNPDFFFFDVVFIHLNTLKNGIFKQTKGQGLTKQCKVYTNDLFIKNFPGMRKEVLPLAAVLLGKNYFDKNIFYDFFSTLIVPRDLRENYSKNKFHYRIETVLRWLQHQQLDIAAADVISKLDPKKQELVLDSIEMIINRYLIPSTDLLTILEYEPSKIEELMTEIGCELFKLNKTETQKLSKKKPSTDEVYLTSIDEDLKNECRFTKPNINITVNKSIPLWFLHEYHNTNFPAYFMDMVHQHIIVIPEQMEDQRHLACVYMSLKVIRAIFILLTNRKTNSEILQYIGREGATVKTSKLDYSMHTNLGFPTLKSLIRLSTVERKNIFISTLGFPDQLIMEFPPKWRLFVAVIRYWSQRADKKFVTRCHIYSVILMIIYHVVKKVIKSGSYFERTMTSVTNQNNENHTTVKSALEKVEKIDCLNAEEFFKLHLDKDEKNFNITVVHAFSLLQNSLRYIMDFNTLLGYPYPNLNVAEFFSGTMIYNFYKDLKKYTLLNQRISAIFENAPSIFHLFNVTNDQIKAVISSDKKCL